MLNCRGCEGGPIGPKVGSREELNPTYKRPKRCDTDHALPGERADGFVHAVEDVGFRQDIVEFKAFKRVLGTD